jgi:hypothetical protein
MTTWFRKPAFTGPSSSIPWKLVKRGDLVDMGAEIFYDTASGVYCDQAKTIFSRNADDIRKVVNPVSYQEFLNAGLIKGVNVIHVPAKYKIRIDATDQFLPGQAALAPGFFYNSQNGQYGCNPEDPGEILEEAYDIEW